MENKNEFWKRKLMAYLHDPPDKCFDIRNHEDNAWKFCIKAGMTEDDKGIFKGIKDADWTASAIDRFTFPKGECSSAFTGLHGETFKHPLSGVEYEIEKLITAQLAQEILNDAIGGIKTQENISENEQWKQKFFLYWRRWLDEALKCDKDNCKCRHLAYLPSDTRIPDHSIWNHTSLTSALQGSRNSSEEIKPAFLLFQVGPVQEFIAQSRSTRDLWSGSYMLSWLTAHAIKAVTDRNGPDCVIFPSLRGQGVFDALYREELYSKILYKGFDGKQDSLWERMYSSGSFKDKERNAEILLNPSLPNRFLALLPAEKAEIIAKEAEASLKNELNQISDSCWTYFSQMAKACRTDVAVWKERWDKQVEFFPQITWQVFPWHDNIKDAMEYFSKLPVCKSNGFNPSENLKRFYKLATETIPVNARDWRYYSDSDKNKPDDGKTKLNNIGFAWSAFHAGLEYSHAARRNTREFSQFITDANQSGSPKDSLTGKDETIGDKDLWKALADKYSDIFTSESQMYGAMSIIKKLWCRSETNYLFKKLDIDEMVFKAAMRFDSVPDIAANNDDGSPYVAIIAIDGDEMGKWISGFHAQFSEALANFSNKLDGKIVGNFNGQLIYAGGDDVLAILPADKDIKCARTLRAVFRGDKNDLPEKEGNFELSIPNDGFVRIGEDRDYIVPGTSADISCGIAIGHQDHPLQHLVQEALAAEKRPAG